MTRGRALCAVLYGVYFGLFPAQAEAATVSVAPDGTVRYQAGAGERNRVSVWDTQSGEAGLFEPGIVAGEGCRSTYGSEAYCAVRPGAPARVEVRTGDLSDEVSVNSPLSFSVVIHGGRGDDELTAPGGVIAHPRPWWLDGFEASAWPATGAQAQGSVTQFGGQGDDNLLAGPGADRFVPGPGIDYVWSGPGADRIEARDGRTDHIDCQWSRDRLVLDRYDFPYGFCGSARRRGASFVLPLYVFWDDSSDGGDTELVLGCPADHPGPCRGEVRLRIRGGNIVFSKRYRVAPGELSGPQAYLGDRTNRRLVRRGAIVTLKGADSKGRPRRLTRRLHVRQFSPGDPA
jgi:RTX calcium-binding nonapeptide repeat (4 copies)